LTTLFERMHRVQTRIRLMPPLIIARTTWRFGSKRRGLTLFAWLCCRPTTGALPQTSHFFAIHSLLNHEVTNSPIYQFLQGMIKRDSGADCDAGSSGGAFA